MTPPEVAGLRLAAACLLGMILGLVYGFLRPLRQRYPAFSDLLFVTGVFLVWLYLGFKICLGDLRAGYWIGLLAGGILWEYTAGRLLRPVFSGFWHTVFRLLSLPLRIMQKFFLKTILFSKNYLHLAKNRVQ